MKTDLLSSNRRFDRITFNPNVLGGKPSIRGMRISVSLVINLVANGMTFHEIINEYPDLEIEDIYQALRYAALTTDDIFYIPEVRVMAA